MREIVDKIIQLQEWLMKLNEENFDEVLVSIKESIFIQKEYDFTLFLNIVGYAASYFKNIHVYAKLIIELNKINSSIKSKVLKYNKDIHPRILYHLYHQGFLTESEVEKFGLSYSKKYYFPFLKIFNDRLLMEADAELFEVYNKNRDRWDQISLVGCFYDSLEYALYNDNLEDLQKFAAKEDFDFNGTIPDRIISPTRYTDLNLSILDISSLYGSKKCFRFLLENGAKFTKCTMGTSVIGQSFDIIKINELNGYDYSANILMEDFNISPLFLSIIYHRKDIFHWIIEEKVHDKVKFLSNPSLVDPITKTNNYWALAAIMQYSTLPHYGLDQPLIFANTVARMHDVMMKLILKLCPDCYKNDNLTLANSALAWSIAKQHKASFLFLLENGFDTNEISVLLTPIQHIASLGNEKFFDILAPKCDLSKRSAEDATLIHYAALGGNINIITKVLDMNLFDPNEARVVQPILPNKDLESEHIAPATDVPSTPYILAVMRGNIDAIKFFESKEEINTEITKEKFTEILNKYIYIWTNESIIPMVEHFKERIGFTTDLISEKVRDDDYCRSPNDIYQFVCQLYKE